ncbi:protein translocase subunit SecD [Brevibacillus daliensis]|uniref:protein translocase subunit SecD n=1 Tax=Brevibacillus daliensis TaxID=2892995 RepID=UPI001E50EC2B|nr:protein translocase subunit SecD [Brevibacillus daliensis]
MIKWSRFVLFLIVVGLIGTIVATTIKPVAGGMVLGLDLKGGFEILYEVQPLDEKQKVDKSVLTATAQMVETRVNIGKVQEPEVTIEQPNRIRVKLAGVDNPEKLRELIGKPAVLTFRDSKGTKLMSGNDLAPGGAALSYGKLNQPVVALKFKDAKKFADITREMVGKPLSIYLDENLITSPTINDIITTGSAIIEGSYTKESAREMAEILNAGALPAKLIEKSVTSVGASLGEMALQKTLNAGVIGSILILIFMLVVYRVPGLIANIMLIFFAYLSLLVLYWMNATLTLPGIAGFILSVGMAVDSNIITNERIQEEIRSGKTILSAFRAGSRRSFITIIDSHVTTLIAAGVLFYFGTSAIQGFALTMVVTIIVSLITNVFGTRFLLSLLLRANMCKKPRWFGVKESEIGEL